MFLKGAMIRIMGFFFSMSFIFGHSSDISIIWTMCTELSSHLEVNKQFYISTQYSRKIIFITIVMDKKFVFHRKCIENILIQIWDPEASLLTHKYRDFNISILGIHLTNFTTIKYICTFLTLSDLLYVWNSRWIKSGNWTVLIEVCLGVKIKAMIMKTVYSSQLGYSN